LFWKPILEARQFAVVFTGGNASLSRLPDQDNHPSRDTYPRQTPHRTTDAV